MARLVVRGELRVSKVLIIMRVFLQKYMGILEMENLLMMLIVIFFYEIDEKYCC